MNTPVFQHVHLLCRDLEPMLQFWTEALGASIVRRRNFGDEPGAELSLGSQDVLLYVRRVSPPCNSPVPPASGYEHIGMSVKNLDAALETILKHPLVSVHTPPTVKGKLYVCFIQGPEGVLVELMEPLQG